MNGQYLDQVLVALEPQQLGLVSLCRCAPLRREPREQPADALPLRVAVQKLREMQQVRRSAFAVAIFEQAHENFLRDLERETGFHVAAGLLRQRHGDDFGNALLSRYPVQSVEHLDLTVDHYEPRGAIDVCIDVGIALPLRVIATHLGLRPGERREQVRRIISAFERDSPHPTLLMGDLNEWFLWGRPLRWLHAHFRNIPPAPPTFPARRPVFALDRIWVSPSGGVTRLARHSSSLARVASDHLPLVADIVV
jgi:endonuclease/exonuclease/phosphatase family metal-dependent hydrolase